MDVAPFTVVLGIAQDAGYPSAGCSKACCNSAWKDASLRRNATSLAVVDLQSRKRWLIDCTPDFREQLQLLDTIYATPHTPCLSGIFLTHAHIGHYTGLMQLGREAMGANKIPVFAMPMMRTFLENNAPWSQLVGLGNITLHSMEQNTAIHLSKRLKLTPLLVPHRGEFSETVGFRIDGPSRSVVFIPDIDSWEHLEPSIEEIIASVDIAYLDATFFSANELPGRSMSEIPHPTILSSMERFSCLPEPQRRKIRFIHLNHTNPALDPESDAANAIATAGHAIAKEGERFDL